MDIWSLNSDGIIFQNQEGKSVEPNAEDIYMYEFKQDELPQPSNQIPLVFNKIPADFDLFATIVNDLDDRGILLSIIVKDPIKKEVSGDIFKIKDYVVHDSSWYPFVRDKLIEVREWLVNIGINTGKLTLRDFLNLNLALRKHQKYDLVLAKNLLDNIKSGKIAANPQGLHADLFEYQTVGYSWLMFISNQQLGAVLADEMGLGKTLQVIALLCWRKENGYSNSIVVAPATLLENWKRELKKFAPDITTHIHRGARRTGLYSELKIYDVVITSYEMIVGDLSMFKMIEWDILVADEAQAIKNPESQRTIALKRVPSFLNIAVTGTPFENHMSDLWSLVDFVCPDLLGSFSQFNSIYPDDIEGARKIEPIISPLILRRRVIEVAKDLPERIDIDQCLELPEAGQIGYESIRRDLVEEYGRLATFVGIGKLKMFCCDSTLIEDTYDYENIKIERTIELLKEIFSNQEKALIFTTYRKMEQILLDLISTRFGVFVDFIDGSVPVENRQNIVDHFSEHIGSAVLILNPKAAGTGLNIVAANHVIHYNVDWNPALEDQASARAYRRGQEKPVRIYRFFYANTIEEIMIERLSYKRGMATEAITDSDLENTNLKDLVKALEISPMS